MKRPVAFLLKSLNKTEKNYDIYNKKMLGVIRKLEASTKEHKVQVQGLDKL